MKHGTRSNKGCNLGKKCSDFHPKMCPMSISNLECFDSKCNLCHVKGTKRRRDVPPPSKHNKSSVTRAEETSSIQKGKPPKDEELPDSTTKLDDLKQSFLDQINLLKKEFQEVVDQKITNLFATMNPPVKTLQPNYQFLPQPNVFQPFTTPQHQSTMFHYPHMQMQRPLQQA